MLVVENDGGLILRVRELQQGQYRYETQEFLLEDNKSKFGTLVLAKNGINLRPHHAGLSVQIGAEVYEFEPLREATEARFQNYEMG